MLIAHDSLKEVVLLFQKVGIDNPWREIRLLLSFAMDKNYEQIFFEKEFLLSTEQHLRFQEFVKRRVQHEPLSKILGCREFWGLNFKVTKDTLDPRHDSEVMIQAVLKDFPDKDLSFRCLDLGTGTGCLLLSVLFEYPKAVGVGVDISQASLDVAKENAVSLGFSDRSTFFLSNWAESIQGVFDLVISNPPYIGLNETLQKNVTNFDPHLALYAGQDGLEAYRVLFSQLGRLCHAYTKIFMEIGEGQRESVTLIAAEKGFRLNNIHNDLAGIERVLVFSNIV